jgi:hypothetical protein
MQDVSVDTSISNLTEVEIGNVTLWFSFKTCVAFMTPGSGKVVSENCWGSTTGKHLNSIDGGNKDSRLKGDDFEYKLHEMLGRYGLV